jgi:Peptidase family S49
MKGDILAIDALAYERMREVLDLHARGARFLPDEAAAQAGLAVRAAAPTRQSTASGGSRRHRALGGTAHLQIVAILDALRGNQHERIRIRDAPRGQRRERVDHRDCDRFAGGVAAGCEEAAAAVAEAARRKRVVGLVDVLAASGAFWIISGASEIVATPSALLGGVGAIAVHDDLSGALAQAGVKRTFIISSPYKSEGNEA